MLNELLMVPSVTLKRSGGGFLLDKKFVSGMNLFRDLWGQPIRCILRSTEDNPSPFVEWFAADDLPFSATIIGEKDEISERHLTGSAIVLASGDDFRQNHIGILCRRLGLPCVYAVEYDLNTRIDILLSDKNDLYSKCKSIIWTLRDEMRRRRAFRQASSLQTNGLAAYKSYTSSRRNDMLYFDNRMSEHMFADEEDLARTASRLATGEPLKLLFTGRLEPMKGADRLIPLMIALRDRDCLATLDIYGAGSLREIMQVDIQSHNLAGQVTLRDPLDFETELIPTIKGAYDIFVCCHPQSDPSCTYMETLACGLPIAGFANDAFRGMLELADAGWGVPKGDVGALADVIGRLDKDRDAILRKSVNALTFSKSHSFEDVFGNRVNHLKQVMMEGVAA